MTAEDFSNQFDVLLKTSLSKLSNINCGMDDLSFNEYEKSSYLTQAQDQVVEAISLGTITGFTNSEIETLLESITKYDEINVTDANKTNYIYKPSGYIEYTINNIFDNKRKILKEWVLLQTNNDDTCFDYHKLLEVIPIKQDVYYSTIKNPFRNSDSLRRVLRVILENGKALLVSKKPISKYRYSYVVNIDPIITYDLQDDINIENKTTQRTSSLPSMCHRLILELAVNLAINSIK